MENHQEKSLDMVIIHFHKNATQLRLFASVAEIDKRGIERYPIVSFLDF